MSFDPSAYGPEVAQILSLDSNGERLMPLAGGACSSLEARVRMGKTTPETLFPGAHHTRAALAGLYLYFSCFDEAHSVSQEISDQEGSFWHGILHRQEPDAGNSAYWFRRVGDHILFPRLREEAARIATAVPEAEFRIGATWDPFGFIDYCEQVRRRTGSPAEKVALEIQRAEWQLLFDYCARREGGPR